LPRTRNLPLSMFEYKERRFRKPRRRFCLCGRLQKYAALAELTRSWPLASRVAIDNTDPAARFLDKTVMLGLDGGLRPQKVIE
ncbi:hypothetical protein, partial [Bradyrhizobium sp. MOS001]